MTKLGIKGIFRNSKRRRFELGTCNEIVNLRYRENAWESIGDKDLFKTINGLLSFKAYHDLGDNNFAVIYLGSDYVQVPNDHGAPDLVFQYYGLLARKFINGVETTEKLMEMDADFDVQVGSINNVLFHNTDTNIQYYVYKNGTYIKSTIDYSVFNAYRESMLPQNNYKFVDSRDNLGTVVYDKHMVLKFPWWDPDYKVYSPETGNKLSYWEEDGFNKSVNKQTRDVFVAEVATIKTQMDELGVPIGGHYLIATLVLYDGTEVAHTAPMYQAGATLEFRFFEYNTASNVNHEASSLIKFAVFCPDYDTDKGMKFKVEGLNDIPQGLIKGVKIYITNPIAYRTDTLTEGILGFEATFKKHRRIRGLNDWGSSALLNTGFVNFRLPSVDGSPYTDVMANIMRRKDVFHFYTLEYDTHAKPDELYKQVAFVAAKDIVDGVCYAKYDMKNWATADELPIDNNSRQSITYLNKPVLYNARVFLSNIKSFFGNGYLFSMLNGYAGSLPAPSKTAYSLSQANKIVPPDELIPAIPYDWHDIHLEYSDLPVNMPITMPTPSYERFGWVIPSDYFLDKLTRWCDGTQWNTLNPFDFYISEIFFQLTLATEDGNKTITSDIFEFKGFDMDSNGKKTIKLKMQPFVYPDSRASKVKVYVRPKTYKGTALSIPANQWYTKEFDLISSDLYNFTYVNIGDYTLDENHELTMVINSPDDYTIQPDGIGVEFLTHTKVSPSLSDQDRVQASSLNNPFNFPAKNSYRVGSSEIIGLQTVNNELSQGQFGEFPMIAFTKSGIWAMNIGSSDSLISSVVPLANEICNNAKSITAIRKGIFFSTNEGLKIIQGAQVVDISDIIEGNFTNTVKQSGIVQTVIENDGLLNSISSIDFLEYVKGASIGYDNYFDEILVSNPDYEYSYVYSLVSSSWGKRGESFDAFFNQFPYLFAIKGNNVYHTGSETRTAKKALIVTNAIGNDTYMKIEQLIARGVFNQTKLMLFGSTDNENFRLVGSRLSNGGYDISLPRSPYSYRSIILVLEGLFDPDSYLSEFDVIQQERYNNKLR